MECELVEVNLGDLLIFVTLPDELTTGYAGLLTLSKFLLLELAESQRMFLQLLAEIGGIGHEHACDGTGVVQANDLHDNK